MTTKLVSRAGLLAMAPATCLLLAQPVLAQSSSSMAQAELQRRANNATEAQELLSKGDESYKAGKWADAVAAYAGARDLLPDAPATAALRKATTERLVQASVEQARLQRRKGDVSGAKATVDKVLAESVAPDSAMALEMRAQLEDPIRTNPAATKEFTQDVEEVRLLLYKAEGFYNLGDYDQAHRVYEEILRVDPYNKAARRGMEQVAQNKADYSRAAYDHARADMLGQVDEAWQLRVTPGDVAPEDLIPGGGSADAPILLSNKLERIILPSVDFVDVSILEAFDFLRARSVELDNLELDPAKRGINFVLDFGTGEAAAKINATKLNLQLRNVPMSEVVKHVCSITQTVSVPQDYAIAIRPIGADTTDMITRSFRVQPDFLTSGAASVGGNASPENDPFGENNAGEGLLVRRMSAEEILKQQGVEFPQGASANFNAGESMLTVRNTSANIALVEQIAHALAGEEPAMVVVEVRMLKTEERVLKELGFDWLLGEFSLGGTGLTPGVAAGHISGGAYNPANFSDIAMAAGVTERLGLTAGNRSGDEAIGIDGIDSLILQQQQGFARGKARAPGLLWANGTLNDTNLTMLMRGLDQKKNVDLVVAPSTTSRSGQQSTIEVIREFIYPTEYEPPELPNSIGGNNPPLDFETGDLLGTSAQSFPVTPATPTSFDMKKVGVILDVLPTVSEDRHYVDVALKPSVTDFNGFVNYGTPITSAGVDALGNPSTTVVTPNEILMPVFSVMKTETNLTVADGATLVIGGMLQERVQKVEDKVPLLGDIPIAGRFFRTEASAPVRTAVVFFVTVKVVDATGRSFSSR
ncbi:type II and III secretion system protein [Luteolibacter flavescens]|uniref:Type II and III secretion system protein n=1 Tax=Luteolibacter flavescens TaxID=1859460 RepID=A0ABT3FUX9_9BACT|nr:Amuc_1098 family type IV pilus outer membrane protein [Luteolibacter flavescens]MCW1887382.1 type II and III secretion system protein [Luteolibacter flavescens]